MYSPYVALTLTSLGDLYRRQNQPKNARKAYEEAVKTWRLMVSRRIGEADLGPDLAAALNTLGSFFRDEHLMVEATKAYEEA